MAYASVNRAFRADNNLFMRSEFMKIPADGYVNQFGVDSWL